MTLTEIRRVAFKGGQLELKLELLYVGRLGWYGMVWCGMVWLWYGSTDLF
jgi:hypothetical protein